MLRTLLLKLILFSPLPQGILYPSALTDFQVRATFDIPEEFQDVSSMRYAQIIKIAEGFIGEQEAETLKTPVDFQSLIELKTRDVLVDQLKADNPGWERSQLWWQSVVDNILLGNKPTYLKVDFSFLRTYVKLLTINPRQ